MQHDVDGCVPVEVIAYFNGAPMKMQDVITCHQVGAYITCKSLILRDVLEAFSEDASILCEQAGLEFVCNLGQSEFVVRANQDALVTVLHNLLSNAIKYNCLDGSSFCCCDREGEWAIVRLINTGKGIPAEDHAKIFDRFYRADRARSRAVDGFGLGLNIAQEMTRAIGGASTLERSDDTSTIFSIAFLIVEKAPANA